MRKRAAGRSGTGYRVLRVVAVLAACVAAAAGCAAGGPPPGGLGVEVAPLPSVSGPLPTTADSFPFLASQRDVTPIDLVASGYLEQEYLVSGPARVYSWPSPGSLDVQSTGQYTTRVLVRRPTDPARSSGRVRVEPLNTTSGHDLDAEWEIEHAGFMRDGDTYVGITVGPATMAALKRFDPARYAPLTMTAPPPSGPGCPPGTPATAETGLAWDMISQVGALVRNDTAANPLRDLHLRRSTLTGWSQSASYDLTYLGAISRHVTLPGGAPVFDEVLPGAGGYAGTAISRCAALPAPGDPRTRFYPPSGVALVVVSTPTDFASAASFRRATDRPADSDTPERRVRLYEIGGGCHLPADHGGFFPDDAELARGGFPPDNRIAYPLSRFPLHVVLDAAFANLDAWVDQGLAPPHAARLTLADPDGWPPETTRDAYGNPLGGVRTPAVDVPVATYLPRGLRAPGSNESAYAGYDVDFSRQYLRVLYPTHADFVAKVGADVRTLQAGRWLTAPDAREIVEAAAQAAVP